MTLTSLKMESSYQPGTDRGLGTKLGTTVRSLQYLTVAWVSSVRL
jgi:hypothetical protein